MNNVTFLLPLALIFILYKYNKSKKLKNIKSELLKNWGKTPDINYKNNDFEYISSYYKNNYSKNSIFIDDITWNDLDMNSVFQKINNTVSFAGESILYFILRKPSFQQNILIQRKELMDFFSKNKILRLKVQCSIMNLGRDRKINISDYISFKKVYSNWKSIFYIILSSFAILSLLLFFYNKSIGTKFLIFSFIINICAYYISINKVSEDIKTINNIVNIINCCKSISKINSHELKYYTDKFNYLYTKTKFISKNGILLSFGSQNELMQYVKIFFLIDIINYNKISKHISKFKNEILDMYSLVGEIDALISASSFRDSLSYYSIPKFTHNKSVYLDLKDIYHPLVDIPVANSISTENSILLTGSNASGKSTFLKSIAISSILSQTINLSLSKYHKTSFFRIMSSMSLSDSIINNESYYIAEIKSLKRIIDVLNHEISTLCFIDEVLRGTNTIERISASSKILEYISNNNCLCFAATHDIELSEILKNSFDNYHFKDNFRDNDIYFDYKLYSGKSQTKNAIKLLKLIGFNDNIINSANDLVENYTLSGTWKNKGDEYNEI